MLRLLRSNSTSPFALAQKAIRRISSPRPFSSVNTVNASRSVVLLESKNYPIPDATTVKTRVIYDCVQSSGFLVKTKFAICSCHGLFVPNCLPRPDMVDFDVRLKIFVSFWDGTVSTAKVLGLDPAADLAVLELEDVPVTVSPLEPSIIRPRILQSCFALGYYDFTFTRDDGFVLSPSVPITFFSKKNSAVFSHCDYVSKDFYAIITQMEIGGAGKSGGPVVDEDQKAMGVLVGGAKESMLAFVAPIAYGMRLLEYVLEKNHDRTILVNHVELF